MLSMVHSFLDRRRTVIANNTQLGSPKFHGADFGLASGGTRWMAVPKEGERGALTLLDRVSKIEIRSIGKKQSAAMRNPALQERRNRQVLADLVRTYIETGEPGSSRAISRRFEEVLSTATIRNIMADLEDGGYLYQPHTSAGRVPTAAAYRFFAQEIASQATLNADDRAWIQRELAGARTPSEVTERAGHVLAEVSSGLGIVVSPPLGKTVLEHARMWLLPDGRVVVVLISPGGATRDKVLRPARPFTQLELDTTADFLNRVYSGWT